MLISLTDIFESRQHRRGCERRLAPVYQEVVKQVPKVRLDYIERVVEA